MTAPWQRILEVSNDRAHFLEFHRPAERRPGPGAGRFLAGALIDGGVAIAIASQRASSGILSELARAGCDPVACMQEGRFILLDSSEMLSRFCTDGVTDAEQFDRTVGAAMRDARARAGERTLRAFGDMVGVLWARDERSAAIDLEHLWIGLQRRVSFALYCAYAIDVFSPSFCDEELRGVFDTHTHVLPSGSSASLGRALDLAIDDVLGAQAKEMRSHIGANANDASAAMPKPEQLIVWMRTHRPDVAEAVMQRAREIYDRGSPRAYLR